MPLVAQEFLVRLTEQKLLPAECTRPFLESRFDRLQEYQSEVEIGQALVEAGHLTPFQLERVLCGQTHGLVLGGYRVLDQLGMGGMGAVYLGEHCLMKRRVALKVMPVDDDCHPSLLHRFYAEMRVLAELDHPNVITAFDAGEAPSVGPNMPSFIYLVMELVDGGDLERHVTRNGRCSVWQACDWMRQASEGLQAAHDRHVVHRDVKPSNLLMTGSEQIKVVDFGLARQFCSQLTDPRALLGSVEFMAPEQSHDPSGVGMEADTYGLGATLFWLLTGEAPYAFMQNVGTALRALQREPPRRVHDLRPDVPKELATLVNQMLSRNPRNRPSPLLAVSRVLSRFCGAGAMPQRRRTQLRPGNSDVPTDGEGPPAAPASQRVLVVDDDASNRTTLRTELERMGCSCEETPNVTDALTRVEHAGFDLVLLNLSLPGMNVEETCQWMRDRAAQPHLKILGTSRSQLPSLRSEALSTSIDAHLPKPAETNGASVKVDLLLRVKAGEDHAAALIKQIDELKVKLERSVKARDDDRNQAHDALLFAMAKMAESRDGETAGHLRRLQRYVRALAERVAKSKHPQWTGLVNEPFVQQMERCIVLHDIGKIGLPDDVLLKPAALDAQERALMETHTIIGDRMLEAIGREHGGSMQFLGIARAIVRHHHERYNGEGYPDRLREEEIPAAARLAHVADVYDALRRARMHKPSLSHKNVVHLMLGMSAPEFDPTLLDAFEVCHPEFERIYREVGD